MSERPPSLAERIEAAGLDWIVPEWPVPPSVQAVLTTRTGGVSAGALATMNLGKRVGDSDETVAVNRRRLGAFLPAEPRWLHQVHGTGVAVQRSQQDGVAAVADAAVTRDPGVVCAVLSADCLPVLLANRRGNVVGVAHAGWRGLAAGVLEGTVAEMKSLGAVAEDLIAWLGPAIGPSAFEVGADVLEACAAHRRADVRFVGGAPGKWYVDLYGLARSNADCGVGTVGGGGFCTRLTRRVSVRRRERDGGRMAALVWLVPGTADPHV
jgi:YfiH family protein